ncbi:Protein CBG25556 [Caenorhabditis briggsae]|uniref:Protein CBG25556 n=1 Tax=Caenorhabditis briggsae TaxID=6238 RepID=B6IF43_CAEBR|nr:Protein CBG25556 [Caenorhabditis briggsae]CAR98523.1 Protein CBG25556 [Caenorhabditis briggsae]
MQKGRSTELCEARGWPKWIVAKTIKS